MIFHLFRRYFGNYLTLSIMFYLSFAALHNVSYAATLQIGVESAQQCVELCRGVGYDCTTNRYNPSTGVCTIISDDNPAPQRVFTIETASASECSDLAQATGQQGSWDDATRICTIGLVYVGCFIENPGAAPTGLAGRVLNGAMSNGPTMTNNECVSSCGSGGYRYAATQYGQYCFCGTETGAAANQDVECSMACAGDSAQICGGSWRNSIYLTHGSGGRTPNRLGYVGCFADSREADSVGLAGRVLNGAMIPPAPAPPGGDPAMTTAMCTNYCASQGFNYAGTQYGSFCFCGNSYEDRGISSSCSMTCSGDPDEICGGPWANSVYRVN